MRHKEEATRTLICSLGAYGTAYILVVVLAGSGTMLAAFYRARIKCGFFIAHY